MHIDTIEPWDYWQLIKSWKILLSWSCDLIVPERRGGYWVECTKYQGCFLHNFSFVAKIFRKNPPWSDYNGHDAMFLLEIHPVHSELI